MTPSLPGPGPGSGPFARRFTRHCQRLACRWAVLSGPVRAGTAVCGIGAGSAVCVLAAAVPGATPGPGDASAGQQRGDRTLKFGDKKRRVTDTILVINCICIMLQWLSKGMLTFWGAKVNAYILQGQLWRLLTPTFLHSGLAHLLVNSYALNSLGPQVEAISGGPRFLTIYLMSAITGTLASFVMTPQPSLGSSGSIFGIAAALAVFYWRHQKSLGQTSDKMLQQLGVTAALNLGCSIFIKNIDNWGHLGGVIGGALLAWLLGPHMQRKQGRFVDQPPLRWLAFPEDHMYAERGREKAALGGAQTSQGKVDSTSSSASSMGLRGSKASKSGGGGDEARRSGDGSSVGGGSSRSSRAGRSRQSEEQDPKSRPGKMRAEGPEQGPD